ncbi:glycoside hydrolase family 65 protein [Treponema primitia]|uniref:glycoside hydrolase family 65 protein n=1 Tax=Treponema primitia TaxID=88058 RepID=UPI000474DFD8|nr:glycosyl hydrolase family 65 protein [Treponema primitia]
MIYKIENLKKDPAALMLNETLFHNANGYIGIRSNYEEGYEPGINSIRGSYINGFYDFAEMKQAEKLYGLIEEKQTMVNVADTQGIQLYLGDEKFSMFHGEVLESRRILNMEAGYTERYIHWRSPEGREAEITIRRLTSFVRPSLFLIDYSVKALNFEGPLTFVSTHRGDVENYSDPNDPRLAAETFQHIIPEKAELDGTVSYVTSGTSKSALLVCTAVDHAVSKGKILTVLEGHGASCRIDSAIGKGETLTLHKYSIFCDSIRNADCRQTAAAELKNVRAVDVETLYREQRDYLADYWEQALLEIDGDDELECAVQYNLYQLIQSVGKDKHSNIAAKGLSGEGYEGHFFWDTEMYIQPFFTLTNPDITRTLISYRYATLHEARKNARLLGHGQGALYPWRTIMGRECSGYFPSGSAQYHINGDIAWSVVLYYLASGDLDFIAQKGGEIIFECARLWMDAGNYYQGKFHINDVTGPDEYTCLVNNNYYTNVSAQFNLSWAVKFYELLGKAGVLKTLAIKTGLSADEVAEFSRAAQNMYLPYDEKLGINPQDDSFLAKKRWDLEHTPRDKFPLLLHYHPLYLYRHQVCKQADTVLAHFIFEDAQSYETIKKSFLYYEQVTTHDSSLSSCIFSIVASKLGFHDKAYQYFGDSAKLDLFNTHGNTKDGIHTANMGGAYMAIVYGFGGLRLKETGLYFAPHLPKPWKAYRFKVHYQGSQILVEVKNSGLVFTLISGSEKTIHVYGKVCQLRDTLEAPLGC